MKNFKLLARGFDVAPLVREISNNLHVWSINTTRQDNSSAQRDTCAVVVRAATDHKTLETAPFRYVGRPTSACLILPRISEFVEEIAGNMTGVLGRVVVVRLKPGGQVSQHTDTGLYDALRHRYHVVLKSATGSRMLCGDEEVRMREGEFWWFQSKVPHEAFNDSGEDRIHLIIDVLSLNSVVSLLFRVIFSPKYYLPLVSRRIVRRARRFLPGLSEPNIGSQ